MAESQARSGPRGRGAGRSGRGGFSARGGRGRPTSGRDANPAPSYEDEGEIGQLKKQFAPKLHSLREMFPDWTDEDLVFALQETDGDVEATVDRISEGNVAQWGEVKKKTKDRTQKKTKDGHEGDAKSGGRGHARGSDAPRGRGRGAERARAGRGRGAAAVNGSKKTAVDGAGADAGGAWDNQPGKAHEDAKTGSTSPDASWEVVTPSEAVPPPAEPAKPKAGTWANLLKPAPKPKAAPAKPKAAPVPPVDPVAKEATAVPVAGDAAIGKPPTRPEEVVEASEPNRSPSIPVSDAQVDLAPSQDPLTETNLEQVQDVSNPLASETVASNAGTNDPRSAAGTMTPQTQPPAASGRSAVGGYATTAQKATAASGRSASHQRRLKDQQEAVVMPGNHAVDRAAVQFGSLGLSGQEDPDDDREEPETRTQPPQHSPVAPRASLPPAQQSISADTGATSRPPGLPITSQPAAEVAATQATSSNYGYNQFNSIYGSGAQGDTAAAQSKQYDPLGQHTGAQAFDTYPAHSQAQAQQIPGQTAYSSAGNDYQSYYATDNQRAYQNYYGYGQHMQPQSQDTAAGQQKTGAGFGASNGEQTSTGTTQSQTAAQNRFNNPNEGQPSGHSTPNPPLAHGVGQGPQSHQVGQQGHGPAGGHGFPYGGNPYYNHHPYYSSYMNQFGYGGRHQGYGQPYGGKYAQPHSYGMSSQSPFDPHSGSPANAGPYGQPHSLPSRDNSSLGSYGRSGPTQPTDAQSHSSNTFSGMSDVFNRGQSGFSKQTSQTASSQQGGADDSSRGYNESAGGPSPAPGQGGARPGSAANLGGQSAPTSQGQGYGAYASQMGMHGQQSQYGTGLGGLGGHHQGQSHQNSGYGGYGSGFGGNYYNSNTRGGWGGNYGH